MTENTTSTSKAPGSKRLTVKGIIEYLESTDELLIYLFNNKEKFISLCNKSLHSDVIELENKLSSLHNHTEDMKSLL